MKYDQIWRNTPLCGDAAAEPPGGLAGRVGRAGAALLRAVSIQIKLRGNYCHIFAWSCSGYCVDCEVRGLQGGNKLQLALRDHPDMAVQPGWRGRE